MSGISKRFPGVTALDGVQFEIDRGEVVGLVGENGAGKSTLMKILAGIEQPDSGVIRIHGEEASIRSPREAALRGISIIHQELELVDTLDIAANVFLGREPVWAGLARLIDRRKIYSETETLLARVGLNLVPQTPLNRLSAAQRQLVEIARALSQEAQILIMDEPTSSLTLNETNRLFDLVKDLRSHGVSVIYISHRLAEIQALADRVIVLRDGHNAGSLGRSEITHDAMVRLMVGRDLERSHAHEARPGEAARLQLQKVRTRRYSFVEVSLEVRRGEILGLAGLVGAGRSELAEAIFGVAPPLSGQVCIDGEPVRIHSPRDAIREGIYLVPEDRRSCGLIGSMSVRENVTLPSIHHYASAGLIRRSTERAAAQKICTELAVKTPSLEATAANLSGGNQQKVVLSKWLSLTPKVILFDEPTRGIDVGAKAEIYQLMRRLADGGVAILMISSDMEEILANSDRVAVMHDGRITGILDHSECTEEAIMRLAVA